MHCVSLYEGQSNSEKILTYISVKIIQNCNVGEPQLQIMFREKCTNLKTIYSRDRC